MKRIRTIFVSLVILLVSMTMVFGTVLAAPTQLDVDPDVGVETPAGGETGDTNGGDDGAVLPGGEGDPDDGFGSKTDPNIYTLVGWADGVDGLGWSQILDLLAIQFAVRP